QFVTAIVDGRKMERNQVLALATGRVFTGHQAFQKGLIDGLGGKTEAVAMAAEMAGIKTKPRIVEDSDRWEQLFSILDSLSPFAHAPYAEIMNRKKIRLDYMLE
ncbi:MAG: hypothetical protein GF384_06910, partial [Elusimicrobia bacterium]|nr:hypothetical protein [Elusimicrobiota bacterium]